MTDAVLDLLAAEKRWTARSAPPNDPVFSPIFASAMASAEDSLQHSNEQRSTDMRNNRKVRMNRLFGNGRCLDVAIDHGVCNEPSFLDGLEDMAGCGRGAGRAAARTRSR